VPRTDEYAFSFRQKLPNVKSGQIRTCVRACVRACVCASVCVCVCLSLFVLETAPAMLKSRDETKISVPVSVSTSDVSARHRGHHFGLHFAPDDNISVSVSLEAEILVVFSLLRVRNLFAVVQHTTAACHTRLTPISGKHWCMVSVSVSRIRYRFCSTSLLSLSVCPCVCSSQHATGEPI